VTAHYACDEAEADKAEITRPSAEYDSQLPDPPSSGALTR
jgi:hypothetical protein